MTKQKEERGKCIIAEKIEDVSISDDCKLVCTAGQLRKFAASASKGLFNFDLGTEAKQKLADAEGRLSEQQAMLDLIRAELFDSATKSTDARLFILDNIQNILEEPETKEQKSAGLKAQA